MTRNNSLLKNLTLATIIGMTACSPVEKNKDYREVDYIQRYSQGNASADKQELVPVVKRVADFEYVVDYVKSDVKDLEDLKPQFDGDLTANLFEGIGQSTELTAHFKDGGYNCGFDKIVLYEDGVKIEEKKFVGYGTGICSPGSSIGTSWSVHVSNEEEGKHVYEMQLFDLGGNMVESNKLELYFSGVLTDKPAVCDDLRVTGDGILKANCTDSGDNFGIKEARLYEDGKLVRTDRHHNNEFYGSYDIVLSSDAGSHKFLVEVVDLGGNITRTPEVTIHYSPR